MRAMDYTERDLIALARRHNNTRREYLLVDPLQAKHVPVSPGRALEMMRALGARLAEAGPEIDTVIGFAETATAVAAAAAASLGHPCRYIHTTREAFIRGDVIEFCEEHSHAVEQRLAMRRLRGWIEDSAGVALVDDELSTGKTMVNAIRTLGAACPAFSSRPVVLGSVISRLDDRRRAELAGRGIRCLSLLSLPPEDYTQRVRAFAIAEAGAPHGAPMPWREIDAGSSGMQPREGVDIGAWTADLAARAAEIAASLRAQLDGKRVTVLGTEECMLPALVLGARLEDAGIARSVRCHATTRSPIGVCRDDGYPIHSGWRLRSFYDPARVTYIYDLAPCDTAIVVTDAPDGPAVGPAMRDLTAALGEAGCNDAILIREGRHVQHLQA